MPNSRTNLLCAEPPVSTEKQYEQFAARLQRQARQGAGTRPWRRALRVLLTENADHGSNGAARLTAWVVADNAVNSLWAGSTLSEFYMSAIVACPQLSRIIFTCPTDGRTGYAPRLVWKSRGNQSGDRRSLASEFRDLDISLHSAALESAQVRSETPSNLNILLQIGRSPAVQWDAIEQFVKHVSAQNYLDCSADEALRILDLSRTLMPCLPDGSGVLTRWRAIKMLAEKGWLNGHVAGQRPLRPHGTAATPAEIFGLVSAAFGSSMTELAGPRRLTSLIHQRYFGAAIIRRATSRTLVEIGSILGGRDHATVINGLDRIDSWNEIDPVHGRLLNMFVQLADNLGIMKHKEFRLKAAAEINSAKHSSLEPGDASASPVSRGNGSRTRRSNETQSAGFTRLKPLSPVQAGRRIH